jgi:hypothetical protein
MPTIATHATPRKRRSKRRSSIRAAVIMTLRAMTGSATKRGRFCTATTVSRKEAPSSASPRTYGQSSSRRKSRPI